MNATADGSPLVYVAGPLLAAQDLPAARAFYEDLAHVCESSGCRTYLPHQRTDPEQHADTAPAEVFYRDVAAMLQAHLVLAYVGAPSSGVGAELAIACGHHIPVIAICGPEGVASRFVEGMLIDSPNATLVTYRDRIECSEVVSRRLRRFVEAPPVEPSPSIRGGRVEDAHRGEQSLPG